MKLGIVTISYNQQQYLQEAIDSVNVAPPHELEYVIVDPGSKDGSRLVIEQNRDRFAKVLLDPDKGPADGLNKGFAACSESEILGYINSDDRFRVGALDFVADYFARNPSIDVLLGGIRVIDKSGRPRLRGRAVDRIHPTKFAARACYIWQQATFFRRRVFDLCGGFNPDNRATWDSELVIRMMLVGARVGYTRRSLGDFRIYSESLTGSNQLLVPAAKNHERLCSEIAQAGYKRMPPLVEKTWQTYYRLNPARHISCLLASW